MQHEPNAKETLSQLLSSPLLVVDDAAFNRTILTTIFTQHGFRHIYQATNGKEALACTQKLKPALIVLDLMMPVMDGFEFCSRLRTIPEFANTPVIAQTALSEPSERLRIFECGATDLIIKPINPKEVIARTLVHLENRLLMKDLQHYHQQMEAELESARHMQEMLIPHEADRQSYERDYGIRVEHVFEPSLKIGGDLMGTFPVDRHRLAQFMVDFSGHGVSAALNTFRFHTLLHSLDIHSDPGAFLTGMNNKLCALLEPGQFATMFYGVIDTQADRLHYASAASPAPVLYQKSADETALLETSGVPLGVTAQTRYETRGTSFHPGDALFTYSDALIEAADFMGGVWTEHDIANRLKATMNQDGGSIIPRLMETFMRERRAPLGDDLTLSCYRRMR